MKRNGGVGRKTMLTPERQERIIQALRIGSYNEIAAQYGGICEHTFYKWIQRGEAGEKPYAQFAQAVKDAQAQAEIRDLTLISKAAEENWQAAAWKLERKNYQRWGRKTQMTLDGGEQPLKIETKLDLTKLSDEELSFLETISSRVMGEDDQSE